MKKALFSLLMILLPSLAWSQVDLTPALGPAPKAKKWTFSGVGLRAGAYGDGYRNIDASSLASLANDPRINAIDLEGYVRGRGRASMSGGLLGVFAEWTPYSAQRQALRLNHRLRMGLSVRTGGELLITYYQDQVDPNDWGNNNNSVGYCLLEDELMLSTDYLAETYLGRLSVYGGMGVSGSASYNSLLMILTSQPDWVGLEAQARRSATVRASGIGGASLRVAGGLHFGMELQRALGLRLTKGTRAQMLSSIGFQVFLRYRFLK